MVTAPIHDYDAIVYVAQDGTYSVNDSFDNVVSYASTDAGASIQTALGLGYKIAIKSGTYNAKTPVKITAHKLIYGSGIGTNIKFSGDQVPTMFSMGDTTQRQVHIRDLQVNSTTLTGTAIDASYFVKSELANLWVTGNKGIIFNAIGSYYNLIRNCSIAVGGIGSVGLSFDNTSNSNTVIGGRIAALDNNPVGVYVNSHSIRMTGLDIEAGSKIPSIGVDVGAYGNDFTYYSPYLEGCDVNMRFANGVIANNIHGGFIADGRTANYITNGAKPKCYNVMLQYQEFSGVLT